MIGPPAAMKIYVFTTSSVYLKEDKQAKAKAKMLLDYIVEIEEIRLYICLGWICVRQ